MLGRWHHGFGSLVRAALVLALSGVAAAEEATGPEPPADYVVRYPGIVFVDPKSRHDDLTSLDLDLRADWCGAGYEDWPDHGLARNALAERQVGDTLAWTVMIGAGRVLAFDDRAAFDAVRRNLRRWADGDALGHFKEPVNARLYYNVNRTLLPLIVGFATIRDDAGWSAEDRTVIERWLGELVWRRGPQRYFKTYNVSSRNNHRYVSAAVTMAWGAAQGIDALFREGISVFLLALDDMEADGSLPLEVTRGEDALHYQRHAITSLIAIAEMAAAQGYDLYAKRGRNGASLHDAVDFLARSLENPRVLEERLEDSGHTVPSRFNLEFLVRRGHERHYMAWLEPYRLRFPDRPAVALLETAMATLGEPERPLIDDHSGGNMTCLFARFDEGDPWLRD